MAPQSTSTWRALSRLPSSALNFNDLHAALNGAPAVLDFGTTAVESLLCSTGSAQLLESLQDVRLDVRPAADIATPGGAFEASGAQPPLVNEWLTGVGGPLVFDTRRSSHLHRRLRSKLDLTVPLSLQLWSRSPVATLGRVSDRSVCEFHERDGAQSSPNTANAGAGGLSFHRHQRSWLLLLAGKKRWYIRTGVEEPATTLQRVGEAELRKREEEAIAMTDPSSATAQLFYHEQLPGECVLVPDGVWHCTYNVPILDSVHNVNIGYGGFGVCRSELEHFVAEGDVAALSSAPADDMRVQGPALARIAVEQVQLDVLQFLHAAHGSALLHERHDDGATLLHIAAGAGAPEVARWLLEHGSDANARDDSGYTPAHFASLGLGNTGSLTRTRDVLAVLHCFGADLEAVDLCNGARPLHYLAGKGHGEGVRWAVETSASDLKAKDTRGQRAEDWAAANGHINLSDWLRSRRRGSQGLQIVAMLCCTSAAALLAYQHAERAKVGRERQGMNLSGQSVE